MVRILAAERILSTFPNVGSSPGDPRCRRRELPDALAPGPSSVTRRLASTLALCLLGGLAAACGERPLAPVANDAPAAPDPRPHVLILVLDACRADRFGAYGFERPTTPAFDALAAEPESVLFERQLAQAPHTRASTASLFTGVYPFQHGVYNEDDLSAELKGAGRVRGRKITERYETLAERFAAGGYRTAGLTSNPVISGRDGYAQGFGTYVDPVKNERPASDVELVERGVAFLAEAESAAFAYVHTSGCHNPTPAERRDEEYFARFGAAFDEAALAKAGVDPGARRFKWAVREGKVRLDAVGVDYLETVYQAVLRKVDRESVARVVAELKRSGLYERTLLVVTADHGEELYDRGDIAHGRTVWNEVVHVPLAVKFPRGARPAGLPARVARVTQTIDLYPGLLKAAGLEPAPGVAGHDLFDPAAKNAIAYAQAPGVWSLLDFPLKVVVFEKRRRAELYDLAADWGERSDLAASRSDDLRRLVRLGEGLQKALAKLGAAEPEGDLALDPEMIEQLRSLGYIQ